MNINSLPKTELHVHIEALMSLDTLKELVRKYKLSNQQIEQLQMSIQSGYQNISDFFVNWHFLNSTLKTAQDFERVTYEYLVESAKFNTKYVELNLNVMRQIEKGLAAKDLVYAIYQGQKQAEKETGTISRTLLSYSRDFSLEDGKRIVDMAKKYKKYNVVGIDIAGNEKLKPNSLYTEVFDYAKKQGIKRTAHAGEGALQNSIQDAIEKMKVSRIGHGIDAINNSEVMELIKKNNVSVEVCVSSNVAIGVVNSLEDHPVKKFIDNGINVVLNTDDPTLLGRSLNDEYKVVQEQWGLTEQDFLQIYRNGVSAAFVEEEVKKSLMEY